jgi:hypothetical protein
LPLRRAKPATRPDEPPCCAPWCATHWALSSDTAGRGASSSRLCGLLPRRTLCSIPRTKHDGGQGQARKAGG